MNRQDDPPHGTLGIPETGGGGAPDPAGRRPPGSTPAADPGRRTHGVERRARRFRRIEQLELPPYEPVRE
ncbi:MULTISPECIES: hypothetical protein [Kitasatospora]|uniref:Uncharacterized protein n=2 Tax=Kitasatospora TaxID=2063 RepID=A0ABT1J3B6_9ACTN|nr:hypothetical protein [Kitasatospora paracochleata]MCP2311654.1 hypothetical protein [Kitasatospora paracochleata]